MLASDHWRDLGNAGWDWSDMLPYFLKSEDQARAAQARFAKSARAFERPWI